MDGPEKILASKTRFCSFVIGGSNPRTTHNRVAFFENLSKRKRVDSAGKIFNNIGGGALCDSRSERLKSLRSYKFNIAFENRSLAGYTTEKIFEPMVARCLPIYWGDPTINEQFNPRSFLNRADFPSDEALIEKIIELDNDDAKYLEYLRQPYFYNDQPNLFFNRQRVLDFFEKMFAKNYSGGPSRTENFFLRAHLRALETGQAASLASHATAGLVNDLPESSRKLDRPRFSWERWRLAGGFTRSLSPFARLRDGSAPRLHNQALPFGFPMK